MAIKLKANQIIYLAGEESFCSYRVLAGLVKLVLHSANGHNIAVDCVKPNNWFGEEEFLSKPRLTSAIALRPSVIQIETRFQEAEVLKQYYERLSKATEALSSFAKPVSERVARIICEYYDARLSHQEIAELAGCTRESVTRIILHFIRQDLIKAECLQKKSYRPIFIIKDQARLISFAQTMKLNSNILCPSY